MDIQLPPPPSASPIAGYLRSLCYVITAAFLQVPPARQVQSRILIQSSNGTIFDVTVTNAGALQVVAHDSTERY